MIPLDKEKQIRNLLKKGISGREIAKIIGVSRGTIQRIKKLPRLRKHDPPVQGFRKLKQLKKARRCNICGGKVKIWPCLLCHPEVVYYD